MSVAMSARLRLTLAVLAVVAVILVGAAGYRLLNGEISFLDALFMTVITVSTVGFEEVWPLDTVGRIWTIIVIAFGIGTVSYAFTLLVSIVVSGELRLHREKRRMQNAIDRLKGHVIMCGHGRMGSLATQELLRRDVSVVVVESREDLMVGLREAGVSFVVGDATDEEVLIKAGLMRCDSLVLTLPSDADNVYVTLTVHTLRPEVQIIARAESPTAEAKLRRAGAAHVVCPQVTGALRVANVLTRPTVVDFVELAGRGVDLEIDEYLIQEDSPLIGRSLMQTNVRRKTGATVVAIKRADGAALVSPDPEATLAAQDTLILVDPVGVSSRLDAIEA